MRLPEKRQQKAKIGQSLVEFVLIMPILVLLTLGAGFLMLAAHRTHLMSNAVAQVALHKLEFANTAQAVSPSTLQSDITGGDLKASFNPGPLVDSVTVADSDPYTSLVTGILQVKSPISWLPSFTVGVSQAINRNLLLPASTGTAAVHTREPWAPPPSS
jgi:TadE-like protein